MGEVSPVSQHSWCSDCEVSFSASWPATEDEKISAVDVKSTACLVRPLNTTRVC